MSPRTWPSREELEAMTTAEMNAFLASRGHDVRVVDEPTPDLRAALAMLLEYFEEACEYIAENPTEDDRLTAYMRRAEEARAVLEGSSSQGAATSSRQPANEIDVERLARAMYARLPFENWSRLAQENIAAVAAEYARLAARPGPTP